MHVDKGGTAFLHNCAFVNNHASTKYGGGAVFVDGIVTLANCTFALPSNSNVGIGNNDLGRCTSDTPCKNGSVSFVCPVGTEGRPITMQAQDLLVTELPPTQHAVRCTPA